MEQISEHGGSRGGADQSLGFEGRNISLAQALGLAIEQPAPRPADAIGLQRALERAGLEQNREAREGAFNRRRAGKRRQRRPQVFFGLGRDRHPFAG